MKSFKITRYDPEVTEKWQDLLKTAKEKGVLEISEPCTKKQINRNVTDTPIIKAILIDCYTLFIFAITNIAMFKCFGLWGMAVIALFCHTHNISYNRANYFHQLIKNWRETQ